MVVRNEERFYTGAGAPIEWFPVPIPLDPPNYELPVLGVSSDMSEKRRRHWHAFAAALTAGTRESEDL